MELSLFLAQLFGLLLLIFIAIAFIRPQYIEGVLRDLKPHSFSMLLAGFVAIVVGLMVILTHNVWDMSWRVVITLFGWAALLKGITYVALPETLIATADKALQGRYRQATLTLAFLLGCYLTYQGFGIGG